MRKTIGDLERKRRKYRKMLHSLGNKMTGPNLIWWESLSQKAQYALLFKYIQETQNPKFKFKHFLSKYKPNFIPLRSNSRNASIDYLIEE